MSSTFDILGAGLSSAIGMRVNFQDYGQSALRLHEATAAGGRVSLADGKKSKDTTKIKILIKTLSGSVMAINVEPDIEISKLKIQAFELDYIPFGQQRLIFGGKELKDGHTLNGYNIPENATLYLFKSSPGEGNSNILSLSKESIAPEFDYDFTDSKDDDRVFTRGGETYKRPMVGRDMR